MAGAAFFDMGRTWGTDVTGATSDGLLKDVGVGLRLGSSRSAFGNVIHIDLAFPLDGGDDIDSVQFVVETKVRFWTFCARPHPISITCRIDAPAASRSNAPLMSSSRMRSLSSLSTGKRPARYHSMYCGMSRSGTQLPR